MSESFNPWSDVVTGERAAASRRARTRRIANAKPKRLTEMQKPSDAVVTTYPSGHPDAPVIETIKTGFETAAYLW